MPWQLETVGSIYFTTAGGLSQTLTPGAPAGITVGDAVLLALGFRGAPSVAVAPAGFTLLTVGATARLQLWGRIATGTGDTPNIGVTFSVNNHATARYARFSGAPASMTEISAGTPVAASGTLGAHIVTGNFGSPFQDDSLVIYAGYSIDDDGPATAYPNSSSVIGDDSDATTNQWLVWSHTVQTAAAAVGASQFTATGIGDQNTYSQVIALKAMAAPELLPLLGQGVF